MKHRRRRMRGGGEQGAPSDETPGTSSRQTPADVVPNIAVASPAAAASASPLPPPDKTPATSSGGGRSRRSKSRKSKSRKTRRGSRKSSKKRTPGKWISHVKKFAKDNNVSFKEAMSSAGCKNSYKKL